jgi:Xaa-Pro aminopeptidase
MKPAKNARHRTIHARRRRAAFAAAAAEAGRGLSGLLVVSEEDVSYLTAFTGADSCLLLGGGWAVLVTDGRYAEQAGSECPELEVFVRDGPMLEAIGDLVEQRRARRLAVQADHMTVQWWQRLGKRVGPRRLVSVTEVVSQLRSIKDEGEVRAICKAVRVAERAFRELIGRGAKGLVGRSEREVAADLDYRMRRLGASAASFETIVAAGAHAALPHYRPGSTKIRRDQPVLIDWGAQVAGYCSDLTRVVFAGRIPPKLAEIYEVAVRAQAAAVGAIRSGVGCKTVDATARKVIAEAGYGREFVHGLGHGIGRQVHEAPALGRLAKGRLRAGMVVTVEPGVYVPGLGGVRIEDDVQVTSDGHRKLSRLPRSLSAMVLS